MKKHLLAKESAQIQRTALSFAGMAPNSYMPVVEEISIDSDPEWIQRLRYEISYKMSHELKMILINMAHSLRQQSCVVRLNPENPDYQDMLEIIKIVNDEVEKTDDYNRGVSIWNECLDLIAKLEDNDLVNVVAFQADYFGAEPGVRYGTIRSSFYNGLSISNAVFNETNPAAPSDIILQKLLEYILGDISQENAYKVISSSKIAPNLEAIMNAAMILAERLNHFVEQHNRLIVIKDQVQYDLTWKTENLSRYLNY